MNERVWATRKDDTRPEKEMNRIKRKRKKEKKKEKKRKARF